MTWSDGKWGPWCQTCGHPSTYHGSTFCMVDAGADHKKRCDCDGYQPNRPVEPIAWEQPRWEVVKTDGEVVGPLDKREAYLLAADLGMVYEVREVSA